MSNPICCEWPLSDTSLLTAGSAERILVQLWRPIMTVKRSNDRPEETAGAEIRDLRRVLEERLTQL